MKSGAAPRGLKHVGSFRKGGLSHSGDPLAAHLGKGFGRATGHKGAHVRAANAPQGGAALGHLGGGVMGTARTVVGHADYLVLLLGKATFLLLVKLQAFFDFVALIKATNTAAMARATIAGVNSLRLGSKS